MYVRTKIVVLNKLASLFVAANGVGAGTSETNLNQVGVYVGGGLGGVVLIAVAILVIVLIGLCLYIRRLKASHHHDNGKKRVYVY